MSIPVRVRVRITSVHRRAWLTVFLFTIGLALALLAQRGIYEAGASLTSALVYWGAFLFLLVAWAREETAFALPIREPARESARARSDSARALFVLPAFLFALIAFFELRENTFTVFGTTAWLTALVLFVLALWEGSPLDTVRKMRVVLARQSRWTMLALAGIFLLGIFFYFYRLDAVPAEMTSDHAEKILDTYDVLNGERPIFFERNTGREPLQFYLNALVVALGIAPLDMLALKVVGALAGVLTIPAVFLLAREMFDDDVGLLAAFFFAVSIFPLAIARVGLRYPLAPLFVAWTCFFLYRALRVKSRNDFLLAGLMLGVGLNGYSPFRVMLLLVVVWSAFWLLWNKVRVNEFGKFVVDLVLMFGAAVLVFVPLLRYLTENPGMFAYRMATRLTSLEEPVRGDPLQTFLQNNWRAFGMFNLRGDVVWVNALPNVPVVDFVIGACFFLGVVYGAYRLVRFREIPFAFLFAAVLILLLPSTLALAFPEENPSVVRAGGVSVFIVIFAALPLALWRRLFARLDAHLLGNVLVGCVLLITAVTNFNLYFIRYDEQYREASWNSSEIAETLREFAVAHNDWQHIYIVSAPHWVDHRAVGIHLGHFDFDAHLIEDAERLQAQAEDPAPKLYLLKNDDLGNLLVLQELYPDGVMRRVFSRTEGRDLRAFYTKP